MEPEQAKKIMAEVFAEQQVKTKLNRITAMPDLLENYDALCERITRMCIFIEFIGDQNRNDWDKAPKRVHKAFRLLYKEMRNAEEEIEQQGYTLSRAGGE